MTTDIRKLIEAVEAGRLSEVPHDLAKMHREMWEPIVKANSGSLDAAKALHEALLPGWSPGVSQNIHSGYWFAWVQTIQDKHFSATESDPARAWLLAILKACEAKQ